MAFSPCAVDGRMYKGRGVHMYPAALNQLAERRKVTKVCPEHWATIWGKVGPWMRLVEDGASWPQGTERPCFRCGQVCSADGLRTLFVTFYEPKAEQADAFAEVCADCFDIGQQDLLLTASIAA